VQRIDAIFDVERSINGLPAEQRLALGQKHVAPPVTDLDSPLTKSIVVLKATRY